MKAEVSLAPLVHTSSGSFGMSVPVEVGDAVYRVPRPMSALEGPVVLTPEVEASADGRAVLLRMDRWIVLHVFAKTTLPITAPDMATAARAGREFQADPGIGWQSSEADLYAWAAAWAERANTAGGGEQ
ncbi:hypothetical protein [Actinopolyspora halophila]|uniref:hypothetical protein n=1 Tax=Actinopolyspora halophila TaxID=1850 RepID=UPI0003747151|nr:hypothetical protein [Actinopolyspora halophila]